MTVRTKYMKTEKRRKRRQTWRPERILKRGGKDKV